MAWRKRFSTYRGRAASWGARAVYRARRSKAGSFLSPMILFIIGLIAGAFGANYIPAAYRGWVQIAMIALACLPNQVRVPGTLKEFAKGYTIGTIVAPYLSGITGNSAGSSGASGVA